MDLKIDIKGMKELEKALMLLPERIAVKHASKAVREGAKVIQKAARAKVPVGTGNLKKSISVKVLNKKRSALQVAALVGPEVAAKLGANAGNSSIQNRKTKNDGYYGHWVEYGTKAHLIKPKKSSGKKGLADTAAGKYFGKEVHHPGIPFQPFMRPAFDENVETAQKVIADILTIAVAEEASKLYRG